MKLKVLVQPNSKKNEVVGFQGDALKIRVKAPPVEGEANDVLVKFLSEALGISRKNISVLHGHTGKNKLIEISTELSEDEIFHFLGLTGSTGLKRS